MSYKLYPSQEEAIKQILIKKRCILTNPCGTGKTLIGSEIAMKIDGLVHIVCKRSKVKDWENELKMVVNKYDKKINCSVTSFESYYKLKTKPKLLIVDESQNMGGFTTRKGGSIIRKAKIADYLILISATPSLNKPLDLYWPLKLCGAYEGTRDDFAIKFNGAIRFRGKHFLVNMYPTNQNILKGLIKRVEVNTSNIRKINLNKKISWIDLGLTDEPIPFEELAKKRQEVGINKLPYFKRFIESKDLKRYIIFTRHREVTQNAAKYANCDYIIGGMVEKDRLTKLSAFNEGKTNTLVISLDAGGEGLNIFNCDECVFLEMVWSPKKHEQALLRMARSEADKNLTAYYLVAKNEHIFAVNKRKEDYFNILGI